MFDLEAFIDQCRRLVGEPHAPRLVLELMREAVSRPEEVMAAVAPLDARGGVFDAPLHRSPELTVLNVALKPGILSIPHDHAMWAVIGIYQGEEVNTFYRRAGAALEESNRHTIASGEAILLGENVIHAIENPLTSDTRGLHVYGGDLLGAARSMWDPSTGAEHPYDIPQFTLWGRDLAKSRKAAAATAS